MAGSGSPLTTIFSKRPQPGEVKTRLCPPLRPAEAADFALALLDDAVDRELRDRPYEVQLAVAPADGLAWFRERYGARLPIALQEGNGLGERLARWFERRCPEHRSVVVVGSDCPLLDRATVVAAHERLAAGADLVLAPDGGGGYSLVGLRRAERRLFTEVPMSTRSMFDETLDLACSLGLEAHLLAEHRDVDEGEDLRRVHSELRAFTMGRSCNGDGPSDFPDFPVRTYAWLRRHPGFADVRRPR